MGRRRTHPMVDPARLPESWVVELEATINGRHLERGTEFSVRGEQGRFRFIKHVLNVANGAEWVDAIGGPEKEPAWRSFGVDREFTVHRINRTRVNAEAEEESES